MKIAVIDDAHVGRTCLSTALKLKEEGIHIIHLGSKEELRNHLLEEELKTSYHSVEGSENYPKPTVILMDSEPIEIKRKPWEDEPIPFTKIPTLQQDYYQDYSKKPSHRRDYKFHK